jgi:anti-anti-sigma regulatory factor
MRENAMATHFEVKEFGRTFATRERGSEIREELLRRAGGDGEVIVDFDGVTNISYSFADEFLGRLSSESDRQIATANTAPRVGDIVKRAVARRAEVRAGC